MSSVCIVILAAGQGKRMRSDRPKVLHHVGERSLLEHVVHTAEAVDPHKVLVVYGHGGEQVREQLSGLPVSWVEQAEQLGTGHALMQALPHIPDDAVVVVLNGDVPLIQADTVGQLAAAVDDGSCMALVTVEVDDPTGYGRIIRRADGAVSSIVEERDASEAQRSIREINTGIMAFPAHQLATWLGEIKADNAQGEYYLTDVIELAARDDFGIRATVAPHADDLLGVNDRSQLAALERRYQQRQVHALMMAGATVRDPARLDVRGEVEVGRDVHIDVNVLLEGVVKLGDRVRIGANTVLRNVTVGDDTEILEQCVVDGAELGRQCRVGPFSRVRPQTVLNERVHVGNFVEIKKSEISAGSKLNHLSYVGDSEVGSNVNVGAGTITCNYDGANKHKTVIGDNAFIGSGAELVAPVHVAAGTTVAAGSTITRDTEADTLAVARSRQQTISSWKRPRKK